MANNESVIHPLFSVFGIELEYMIVDKTALNVLPIADELFHQVVNQYVNDIERGDIAWSNELVLHVVELKTNGPTADLGSIVGKFHDNLQYVNELLSQFNACLMPTGAHPWMDPHKEAKLWPHGDRQIYQTYNRIFDCRGHGWSNLQSGHLNLPFADDQEFAKLHSAIRLLLPIMPAITASTPIIDGKLSGMLDTRLSFYGQNQRKIPRISGLLIPEIVLSAHEYELEILQPMYRDIAPHDPEGILQEEWLNSRAAIARFDRNAIEIRILDTQECPLADIACMNFIVAILRALVDEKWSTLNQQNQIGSMQLRHIFDEVIKVGPQTIINNKNYLQLFGYTKDACTVKELLIYLLEEVSSNIASKTFLDALQVIVGQGNLAERMVAFLSADLPERNIKQLYQHLIECLQTNKMFLGQ